MAEKQAETVRTLTGILHIAKIILSHLDVESLRNASRVSPYWHSLIRDSRLWRRQLEKKVASDPAWAKFAKQRRSSLPRQLDDGLQDEILYEQVEADVNELDDRWKRGQYTSKIYPGTYYSYVNGDEIATVSKDDCLRIWNSDTGSCVQTCNGVGRMPKFRFDHRMVICAYYGGELRIWDRSDPDGSGPCNVIRRPDDQFDDLEFNSNFIVTEHRGRAFVFEINSPRDVRYCTTLTDYWGAHVGGDLIILTFPFRLVDRRTHEFMMLHKIKGGGKYVHDDRLVVSKEYRGSIDRQPNIYIWDMESSTHLRTLVAEGLSAYPIALDSKRIAIAFWISLNLYRIRIWDLKDIRNKSIPNEALACTVLEYKSENTFIRMDINEFQLKLKSCSGTSVHVIDFRNQDSATDQADDSTRLRHA